MRHAASVPAVSLKIKLTTLALCYEQDMTKTASTPFDDLDDYLALPRVSGLAVSPDGSRVVTTVAELNDKRTEFVSCHLGTRPGRPAPARRLTRGAKGESSPVFTADGDVLFVAVRPTDDDDKPPASLWRLPAAGGEAVEELALPGGVGRCAHRARGADHGGRRQAAAVGDRHRRGQAAAGAAQGHQGLGGAAHRLSGAALGPRPRPRSSASARRRRTARPDARNPATRCARPTSTSAPTAASS